MAKRPPRTPPASTAICPTCGGQAVIDGDRLRCPDCSDRTGTIGELLADFACGGPLSASDSGDESIRWLRDAVRERWGDWSADAVNKLRDWLVRRHGMTSAQTIVAKVARVVELLDADAAEARPEGETPEAQGDGMVTIDDMATLVGMQVGTLRNKKPPAPAIEGSGRRKAQYRWADVLPWLREHWRNCPHLDADYSRVRAYLDPPGPSVRP